MKLYQILLNSKGLQTVNQNISILNKQLKNEPFIKNLLNQKYLVEYLKFPEYKLSELNNIQKLMKPIESTFNEIKFNESIKRINEALNNFKLYGQTVPGQYDGLELDMTTQARILEIVSVKNPIYAIHLLIHNEIVSKAILLNGTEEQKEKYSKVLANGLLKGSYCYSEPQTGCDVANFKVTAMRKSDNTFKLNGVKCHVTLNENDLNNQVFLVLAKVKSQKSIEFDDVKSEYGLFLIENNEKNDIKMTKETQISEDVGLYEISFNDVSLDSSSQIGTIENSLEIIHSLFNNARFLVGSICIGLIKDFLKHTIDYTLTKRQFDHAVCDMNVVKERLCRIECNLYAMESVVYMTGGILDSYVNADVVVESNLTKIFCTDMFMECLNEFSEIYTMNTPARLDELFKIGRLMKHFLNSNDILKQYVAIECASFVGINQIEKFRRIRDPFNNYVDVYREWRRLRNIRKNLLTEKATVFFLWESLHPSLNTCADMLENSSVKLIQSVQKSILYDGARVVENHLNLKRITNLAMYVYVINCCLARCSRAYSIGLPNSDYEKFLVHILVYFLKNKIDFNYNEIIRLSEGQNVDDVVLNISDKLLKDKKYSIADCLMRTY